jgi:hypothetical protein
MSNPKYLKHIIFALLSIVWSCTEKIDLKLDEGVTKIVIEGTLSSTYRNQIVKISKTRPYYEAIPVEPVRDAIVTMSDSGNIYAFTQIRAGFYVSKISFAGVPNREYKMKIEIGNEVFEATSVMPRIPKIDSIQFYSDPEDAQLFHIGLFAQENPLPGDYYFWGVYKDYIYQTTNITQLKYMSDELINGSYFNGNKLQSVFAKPGNRITLQMGSITREYFNYSVAVLKETIYNDGIFKPAPANLEGNISNGALGFFVTYTETFKTQIIKIEQ